MYREMLLSNAIKVMRGFCKYSKNELVRGVSIDTRTLRHGELFFALKGENTDGHNYTNEALKKGAVGVVVQKQTGVRDEIMVNNTLFALGELANYYLRWFNVPVIAITGTNGKTTVKNLIAAILSARFKVLWSRRSYNSLIGLPLTIFEISGMEDYLVLEMGTSNPGEIKRLCEIAPPFLGIVTSIGPGHLKGLGSIDGVRKEKLTLIESLPANGMGFVGPNVDGIKKNNVFRLNFDEIKDIKLTEFGSFFIYKGIEFFTSLLGLSNVYNCFIALTVTEKLGIETEMQKKVLRTINPEPGRMEPIRINDLLIINDTYNANPASMKSAIDFISILDRRKIFILGDMLELGDNSEKYHQEIGTYAREHCDYLLSFGNQAEIYGGLHFKEKDSLVNHLIKILKGNEVILVKASRAMRFDSIVTKILRRL